ncbi:aminopeptidase YpdF [Halalkalibacter wakoensis JCM 9140]|uniref:Aminopeptidase YpdF n=1 Tax=Halalkalibacter wakoensis JCM 9140 TaxID=1236970 RepID=W4Q525_9BACI|nr:Xaa-Pro peptidase family protein [Halalkalibacter wakoensis]GAE27196.1 aminopeptidase YpdF [Halalkalibacter wakoensis JCM 9140]
MFIESRLKKLRKKMREDKVEGALFVSSENRRYFSNFTGTSGAIIITETEAILLTDFRYVEQANEESSLFHVIQHYGTLAEEVVFRLKKLNLTNVGIEDTLPIGFLRELEKGHSNLKPKSFSQAVNDIRKIKDQSEIEKIKKGVAICDLAFEHILSFIQPGLTEKEIGLELEYIMKKNGAEGIKANHVIASGERSALPHGAATNRVVAAGEFVKMDIGAVVDGYYSDFTRTVVIGEPSQKQREIYDIVHSAQLEALKHIGPGKVCAELDEIARSVIREAGYGDHFGHSLGHALGLNIHEKPVMRSNDYTVLEPGMVITVEPGIYLSGWGGVRIEDLLIITEDRYENATKATKELQIIHHNS